MDRNLKGQFFKGCKTGRRTLPIVGEVYNFLEIISDKIKESSDGHTMWNVRCKCGKEFFVRANFLRGGRQKGCKSCAQRAAYYNSIESNNKIGFIKLKHEGYGDITKTYFNYIKRNGKRRDIEWSNEITIEYLWNLYLKQDKKCKLSGLDIEITTKRKNNSVDFLNMTASLDRIDNSKGYVIDNVQWVHKDINRLKWAFSQKRLFELCKLIYDKNMAIMSQDLQMNENVVGKVQRLTGEDSTNNPDTSAQQCEKH
jgi:hypothetical protein